MADNRTDNRCFVCFAVGEKTMKDDLNKVEDEKTKLARLMETVLQEIESNRFTSLEPLLKSLESEEKNSDFNPDTIINFIFYLLSNASYTDTISDENLKNLCDRVFSSPTIRGAVTRYDNELLKKSLPPGNTRLFHHLINLNEIRESLRNNPNNYQEIISKSLTIGSERTKCSTLSMIRSLLEVDPEALANFDFHKFRIFIPRYIKKFLLSKEGKEYFDEFTKIMAYLLTQESFKKYIKEWVSPDLFIPLNDPKVVNEILSLVPFNDVRYKAVLMEVSLSGNELVVEEFLKNSMAWGLKVQPDEMKKIRDLGFNTIADKIATSIDEKAKKVNELLEAARQGNLATFNALAASINLNTVLHYEKLLYSDLLQSIGNDLFYKAIEGGNLEIVESGLRVANVLTTLARNNNLALRLALTHDRRDVALRLLQDGIVRETIRNDNIEHNEPILMLACEMQDPIVLQTIIAINFGSGGVFSRQSLPASVASRMLVAAMNRGSLDVIRCLLSVDSLRNAMIDDVNFGNIMLSTNFNVSPPSRPDAVEVMNIINERVLNPRNERINRSAAQPVSDSSRAAQTFGERVADRESSMRAMEKEETGILGAIKKGYKGSFDKIKKEAEKKRGKKLEDKDVIEIIFNHFSSYLEKHYHETLKTYLEEQYAKKLKAYEEDQKIAAEYESKRRENNKAWAEYQENQELWTEYKVDQEKEVGKIGLEMPERSLAMPEVLKKPKGLKKPDPAKYKTLPLNFDAGLIKDPEVWELYVNNPFHTVWRYYLQPNPWLNPDADYVHRELDGTGWAEIFKTDLENMAYMWLAASDPSIQPIHNYTKQQIIDLFVSGISSIARSHNWDTQRSVLKTIKGESVTVTEYYDDLTLDRPSCAIGVSKRLITTLTGHPLCEPEEVKERSEREIQDARTLNHRIAKNEVLEWITTQFHAYVRDKNPDLKKLMELFEKQYIDMKTLEDPNEKKLYGEFAASLNIKEFIEAMTKKYGDRLGNEKFFSGGVLEKMEGVDPKISYKTYMEILLRKNPIDAYYERIANIIDNIENERADASKRGKQQTAPKVEVKESKEREIKEREVKVHSDGQKPSDKSNQSTTPLTYLRDTKELEREAKESKEEKEKKEKKEDAKKGPS